MGVLGDADRPGQGRLFHSRRHIGCVSQGRVLAVCVGAEVFQHDEAGVDSDSHAEVDPMAGSHLRGIRFHGLEDRQAGHHRPFRVVFVGNRGSEVSEDRVTEKAGDGAPVSFHGCEEPVECSAHDLRPALRVELFGGSGRARDVAEHQGDGSPLS